MSIFDQQELLESLSNLVVVINPDTSVDYVSPSVKDILGFEPELLKGEGWWNLTKNNEAEKKAIKTHVRQLFASGAIHKSDAFEREIRTASGKNKWILWKASEIKNNQLVGVGYDITERKNNEKELNTKNNQLHLFNKNIVESIEYARLIQNAMLPRLSAIENVYDDAFIIYKPKNIVNGDMYWAMEIEDNFLLTVIDCTGHGVPGALLTVMANAALKEIVVEKKVIDPAEILYQLDRKIIDTLNKNCVNLYRAEGMDMIICCFNKHRKQLTFSGACRPLILIRNKQLTEFSGDKSPIGYFFGMTKKFTTRKIEVKKDDMLYLFTDGYSDQFGGINNKKFRRLRFKKMLLAIHKLPFYQQKRLIENVLDEWMGTGDQVDDITIMGLKV